MRPRLKNLADQRIVITGASSGIGLVTARMAARKGARLVLAARSGRALERLADEINGNGGEAIYVVADVSREEDVQNIADEALRRFDGFDTWVNNAAISIYGRLLDVPIQDMRQLFETNYWGLVYGSLIAGRYLKDHGGALINVGSTLSDRALPIQGTYCASKHAVKAFTDALRMELEAEGAPVSVTLIKPGSIDTPYRHHAKSYMNVEPKNPGPVYAPELVAKAILHCAEHPKRDVFVGGGGKMISLTGYYTPRLADKLMERFAIPGQRSNEQPRPRDDNGLNHPSGELKERGNHPGHVCESSAFTKASLHPIITTGLIASAGVALTTWLRGRKNGHSQGNSES